MSELCHNPRILPLQSLEVPFRRKGGDGVEFARRVTLCPLLLENMDAEAVTALAGAIESTENRALTLSVFDNGDTRDVLLIGTDASFEELPSLLSERSQEIRHIADEILDTVRRYRRSQFQLQVNGKVLPIGSKTLIMGVVNVTPDSFYEGSRYFDKTLAIRTAVQMAQEGADIVDIGGQSTRPGADDVSETEEANRVLPVLNELVREIDIPISIDTCRATIARKALDLGAGLVNDVTALRGDAEMAKVVASYKCPVVLMHMKGTPRTMQDNPTYECVVSEIIAFLKERISFATSSGIGEEQIIVDPGIGFGKTTEHNLDILRNLRQFRCLGRPILIGTSRKSLIGSVLDLPTSERLEGTAATLSAGILNGGDIFRVHDVKEMARVAAMTDAIARRASEPDENED